MATAYISEIFPTIQGEGPHTGERQIFVRMAGCPLRCDYCDTPDSLVTKGHPTMDSNAVIEQVQSLCHKENIETVSFTGGEPLVQSEFLKDVLPKLQKTKIKTYLETAGIHPKGLQKIVEFCDVVSMDIKLPSATEKSFWDEHADFLKIGGKKVFVKIVIEEKSSQEEFEKAISVIQEAHPQPLVVIQPVTPQPNGVEAPQDEKIQQFLSYAKSKVKDVRVMPQQHKVWNVR